MLCRLTRWMVSRAEDRGKDLPRFAARHIERCGHCRGYSLFVASLSSRFPSELPQFLAGIPDIPLIPAGRAAESGDRAFRPRRFLIRPFPAAAAGFALAGAAIALFLVVRRPEPLSSLEKATAIAAVKSVTSAPSRLGGFLEGPETALAQEREILEKSFLSAVEYFQDRLNIRVEVRDAPKSL